MNRTAPAAPESPTTLSLIISSLDEGTDLYETLRSVFAGSVIPTETVVVDDGGSDGSCAALERDEWRARGVTVHHIERSGVAAARNVGGRLSQGTYLLFLDAHCRLEQDCLARLQAALIAEPDAILAPALCDVGSTTYGCGARLIDAELRVRWLPPGPDGASYLAPIAPGGCLALSRATFDHLNGFGVFRELGLEDVDFSLRAWRAGIDVLAVPSARLTHRFRPNPPYRLSSASRSYNVARVALIHFSGNRRAECLRRIIGTPRAAEVLVDAFSGDWEEQRNMLVATSVRSIEEYFERFGDWT
ncbi:glycosyltransferase family 2 protein [Streptomyces sp. I6]|uniref:glycosyltransferase family 2 protein n=1 Tax=Streptomyces sp. I6 TaxID=2483113 RepID=UPI000F45E911|nr:glycosyltransferase [Streptomyces sp. I6]RNL70941.1 glycosyltransferase [Streptomyces sp. I6]